MANLIAEITQEIYIHAKRVEKAKILADNAKEHYEELRDQLKQMVDTNDLKESSLEKIIKNYTHNGHRVFSLKKSINKTIDKYLMKKAEPALYRQIFNDLGKPKSKFAKETEIISLHFSETY